MEATDSARLLFVLGTLPFIVLGTGHALGAFGDTFRPRLFTPRDDDVRRGMMGTSLRLTHRANVWRAWLGFNLSHGLGLIFFGLILLLLSLDDFQLLMSFNAVMPFALAIAVAYFILAVRFWFRVPAAGCALGAACFAASYVLL